MRNRERHGQPSARPVVEFGKSIDRVEIIGEIRR